MDDAAAEADVVVVENDGLSRSDGALWDIEGDEGLVVVDMLNCAGLVGLSVTNFGVAFERESGGWGRHPGEFIGCEEVSI